jgi:Holliday junction resolvase-like predicted endonuclease
VSRIEADEGDRVTVATLNRVAAAVGARVRVLLLAHGEDVDRLLDSDHAAIVERVARLLRLHGWEVVPEATFSVYGERGSIDLLAFHAATGALLVIEVKSAIPDVQATLAGIDRKARLAVVVAKERRWPVRSVSRWLVVPGDRKSRRRVAAHETTFRAALPGRTRAMQSWAADPRGAAAGIVFVAPARQSGSRHRIRPRSA